MNEDTREGDSQAIRMVFDDFLKPFESGDVDGLLDFYTDDARTSFEI